MHRLQHLFTSAWTSGKIPPQWKDVNIISIYKRKGDKADCSNSRGISLLSTAGKVLARVMLSRLLSNVADVILPEYQCDFRRSCGTLDMIFIARLLQEKCREQHKDRIIRLSSDRMPLQLLNGELLQGQRTVGRHKKTLCGSSEIYTEGLWHPTNVSRRSGG